MQNAASANLDFWKNKRVFLTSPTSFLGVWTALSLRHLGAEVFGFGEAAAGSNLFDLTNLGTEISMTYGDIRDEKALRDALQFASADVVLHLGESGFLHDPARSSADLVAKSVVGTTVLMELLRETASVRSVVVVSSDKVYERSPDNVALSENDKVGSQNILTTAKLSSELIALSYRGSVFNPDKYNKHKIAVATARLGVGFGGGDFAEKALIPQFVQSVISKNSFEVRNPMSQRPWIHVLDQVRGLLLLAEKLFEKGPKLAPTYNLGAAESQTVSSVLSAFAKAWGPGVSFPDSAFSDAKTSVHGMLNSELAFKDLGWKAKLDMSIAVKLTAAWYRQYYETSSAGEARAQVREFFEANGGLDA